MIHSKRNLDNKKVVLGYSFFILLMVILAWVYRSELSLIVSDPQHVRQIISNFGFFGPIILILVQIFQVVIFVIPGPVFTIAGGYSFGLFWGTVYSLIGTTIGSVIVFYMARRFGRPFVAKIVNKKELQHFDAFFKKRGKLALFITRTMPILFPNDAVSFAAGLTPLSMKAYLIISFLGYIPNLLILNLFGNQLSENMNPITLILVAIVGFGILAYLLRHPLKIIFIKEIRDFEAELKVIESKSVREIHAVEEEVGKEYRKVKGEVGYIESKFRRKS